MAEPPRPEETVAWQRRLAAQANNRAWALADAPARSAEEDEDMLQAAHAAMHLWKLAGNASNRAHAAQLLAHVYALLKLPHPARHYLRQSQPHFLEAPCAPWELAYAHLVAASVAAAEQDIERHRRHHRLAREAIAALDDPEDIEILQTSMRAVVQR